MIGRIEISEIMTVTQFYLIVRNQFLSFTFSIPKLIYNGIVLNEYDCKTAVVQIFGADRQVTEDSNDVMVYAIIKSISIIDMGSIGTMILPIHIMDNSPYNDKTTTMKQTS